MFLNNINNIQQDEFSMKIGLEIHITLKSEKKIFNWKNTYQGWEKPNDLIGPWELGYPGILPIINPQTIELGLKLALALKMKIEEFFIFERKIYNYYDLPKGFQITQKSFPFAKNGYFFVLDGKKKIIIKIKSLQLEEDTAKSVYCSEGIALDFNRAGNPLIELVTNPIFLNSKDVLLFLQQFRQFLIYLDVSSARMERGQMRVDLNYSLVFGEKYKTPRYEIKNLNSFNNIKNAIDKEIEKHFKLFKEKKIPPVSSTISYIENINDTVFSREKKEYFFLPEFNLVPIKITKKELSNIKIPSFCYLDYWKLLLKENDIKSFKKFEEALKHPFFSELIWTLYFLIKKKMFKKESFLFIKWTDFFFNFLTFNEFNRTFFYKNYRSLLKIFDFLNIKKINKIQVENFIKTVIEKRKIKWKIKKKVTERIKKK